ncbi:MAG: histidine phosphatase family protein [Sediminicola sp.]|tara:strand:- start:58537 stop:59067 length:531 start_codon:yes stop_codon:yes gene_type:complete
MKATKHLFIIFTFCGSLLTGCKEDKVPESPTESVVSTFYFIRHAEKDRSDPNNNDPELNQDGLGRAMRWAEVFDAVPLDRIYSTDYERTTMTAAPTAVKKDITVQYYQPQMDLAQFKADNLDKKVLVVGHSNTTPELVNKMIGENIYPEIPDYDNGQLFIVQIIDDKATHMMLKID